MGASSMTPIPAGTRLGPYEIVALIGAGGMGQVDRARHPRLDLAAPDFFRRPIRRAVTVLLCAACLNLPAPSQTSQPPQKLPADLTEVALEELMNIEITSVAKREQKLSDAPAAVYVLTKEDIRRSGATSIAEALRMVPGLQVARINANVWAISSRGFAARYSNKMLVLVDGRSVYTPTFSGVFWDVQDMMLEDIDRIEVIRGPGGTLWGANAVNGVINIISKHAKDTQGGLVSAGGGSEEEGFGGLRYGGKVGSRAHYRVYSKYFQRDALLTETGQPAADGWHAARGGFRADWEPAEGHSITMLGDLYGQREGQIASRYSLRPPFTENAEDQVRASGGNLLTRWRQLSDNGSETALQFYYDRYRRSESVYGERRHTVDLDFQHRRTLGSRHDLLWGLGYRFTSDRITESAVIRIHTPSRGDQLFSAFLQDEIPLLTDRLFLTFGSKFEHNDYTGLEVQPSVQLLWRLRPRHTAWGSISRAVRTPSRGEDGIQYGFAALPGPVGIPILVTLTGDGRFRSEHLRAQELGYRLQATRRLSLDLASFYNAYNKLISAEPGAPSLVPSPPPLHLAVPAYLENKLRGETYGGEISAAWLPVERWKLAGGYAGLRMQFRLSPDSTTASFFSSQLESQERQSPRHQLHLRSYFDFTRTLQLDTAVYHVGSVSGLAIPSYTRLDLRVGWHPVERLDLSLGLQNLLDARHPEFVSESLHPKSSEVGRSAYGKITWRF